MKLDAYTIMMLVDAKNWEGAVAHIGRMYKWPEIPTSSIRVMHQEDALTDIALFKIDEVVSWTEYCGFARSKHTLRLDEADYPFAQILYHKD